MRCTEISDLAGHEYFTDANGLAAVLYHGDVVVYAGLEVGERHEALNIYKYESKAGILVLHLGNKRNLCTVGGSGQHRAEDIHENGKTIALIAADGSYGMGDGSVGRGRPSISVAQPSGMVLPFCARMR